VVRATEMAVLYLAARAVDHRARPFNAVAASAGITAAIDPLAVCDAGAWLTYGATVAILAGTPLLLARVQSAGLASERRPACSRRRCLRNWRCFRSAPSCSRA